ncbi:MAG: LysE family translocator [Paracoccaceae bacterium]
MADIAALALTSLIVELTPGPNMTYLALVAAAEGRGRGYAAVAGVALGLAVVGVAAALGLTAVVQASPAVYQALRWGGAAYLLWLAWDGWRGAGDGAEHAARGSSHTTFFRRGLVTNLLNPKAAVFYLAVLPGFVAADAPVLGQTLLLTAVYVAVATGVHATIVTAAGAAHRWLSDPGRERVIRRGLSLALAGVAVWFLWKT